MKKTENYTKRRMQMTGDQEMDWIEEKLFDRGYYIDASGEEQDVLLDSYVEKLNEKYAKRKDKLFYIYEVWRNEEVFCKVILNQEMMGRLSSEKVEQIIINHYNDVYRYTMF